MINSRIQRARAVPAATLVLMAAWFGAAGCVSTPLPAARENLYLGRYDAADQALVEQESKIPEKDRALYLMERGMIRQAKGDYAASAADLIAAADTLERIERASLTKDGGSFFINDTIKEYRGTPYEQVLLHAVTALDHFARGMWDEGAIEARRTINAMEPKRVGKYPIGAFGPYVAGFAFEMINDGSNASLMYRKADALARPLGVRIDANGRLAAAPPPPTPARTNEAPAAALAELPDLPAPPRELVCFVLMGRGPPRWMSSRVSAASDYAEVFMGRQCLGRSYLLADTDTLAAETDRLSAAARAAKKTARILLKDVLADMVEKETDSPLAGFLAHLVLLGVLEQDDYRRWETLPHTLQVLRVPCPENPKDLRVIFHYANGAGQMEMSINRPVMRNGNTWVTFCRQLPPARP